MEHNPHHLPRFYPEPKYAQVCGLDSEPLLGSY